MATTPINVVKRPFSVEPITKIMMPDGIFDTAIKHQLITCHFTNESNAALNGVTIYLEGVGDPGILITADTHSFAEIPPGASVKVSWLGDFEAASPGKKLVSFIAQAQGMDSQRLLKRIFVSQTREDPVTGDYTITVEEGSLQISKLLVHGPRDKFRPCDDKRDDCVPTTGPWVPAEMTMVWHPNPAYEGLHGDLPFSDPWWKVLAWIVAAVAAIVAIVAAAYGAGTAGTAVTGTFDETTGDIDCCAPDPGGVPGDDSYTVAGVASVVATVAVAVGMSDAEDPWWRGQEQTPPKPGELTVAERVDAVFEYPDTAPLAGEPYPVKIKWTYDRITTGNTYQHAVDEVQHNVHVSGPVTLAVPAVHHAFQEPLVIEAKFEREDGNLFTGDDLYAFCLLRSPDDMYFFVDLLDDGIDADKDANDGVYTGSIHLERVYKALLKNKLRLEGLWRIYAFAQDINGASEDMLPEVAATHIGGFMVASAIQITFDPSLPCPLQAQATVQVVA